LSDAGGSDSAREGDAVDRAVCDEDRAAVPVGASTFGSTSFARLGCSVAPYSESPNIPSHARKRAAHSDRSETVRLRTVLVVLARPVSASSARRALLQIKKMLFRFFVSLSWPPGTSSRPVFVPGRAPSSHSRPRALPPRPPWSSRACGSPLVGRRPC